MLYSRQLQKNKVKTQTTPCLKFETTETSAQPWPHCFEDATKELLSSH